MMRGRTKDLSLLKLEEFGCSELRGLIEMKGLTPQFLSKGRSPPQESIFEMHAAEVSG